MLCFLGEIDVEEMVEIFSLMYTVQVSDLRWQEFCSDFFYKLKGFTEEEGKERAEKIFETLDKNGDGSLEEEEFIKVQIGCICFLVNCL